VTFELSIDGGFQLDRPGQAGGGSVAAGPWAGLSLPLRRRDCAPEGPGHSRISTTAVPASSKQVASYALPGNWRRGGDGPTWWTGSGTGVSLWALLCLADRSAPLTFDGPPAAGRHDILPWRQSAARAQHGGDYVLSTNGLAGALARAAAPPSRWRSARDAIGTRTATLQIASNDGDESPFDIGLSGTGSPVESRFQSGRERQCPWLGGAAGWQNPGGRQLHQRGGDGAHQHCPGSMPTARSTQASMQTPDDPRL